MDPSMNTIVFGESLQVLRSLPDCSFHLCYIDPPFNTGRVQRKLRMRTVRDEDGDRVGFGGQRYRTEVLGATGWVDRREDYLGFLEERLRECKRVLTAAGSLFVHLDYREVHYCKVLLDGIFGRECFMNEIVWAYDYGGRTKRRWPAKHDNILWYVQDPSKYVFRYEVVDRIPYMAPGLVGPEKARRGKAPTDVWWQTIVPPGSKEQTGYPTQKPLALLERIVRVHSLPGDRVLDFFAGSGTTGEAAARNGCTFFLVDNNPEAVRVMASRLRIYEPVLVEAAGEGVGL